VIERCGRRLIRVCERDLVKGIVAGWANGLFQCDGLFVQQHHAKKFRERGSLGATSSKMNNYLKGLLAIGFLSMSISAQAAPILTTVACDSTGVYTCLTRVENFEVGEELYNADFVVGSILTVFQPLESALFWNSDVVEAKAFASTLADLLQAEQIDGFLSCPLCEQIRDLPFTYTFIPIGRAETINLHVSNCFVGTQPMTGEGFSHCVFDPGSNTQNWAVITKVPEPATIALLGLGLLLLFSFSRGTSLTTPPLPNLPRVYCSCR
jgi:hypothetical protein